jgi:hypothetical protein
LVFVGNELQVKRMFRTSLSILFIFLLFNSCLKIEQLPPEPRIEFTSFEVFDTLDILGNNSKGGRLKFYFEDGDGDLGLKEPVGILNDTTNLFLTLFRKVDGSFVEADDNDILAPSGYRIPYMTRLGQNKILKGTISVALIYLFSKPTDTIRYDFFIRDRALHDSNTATTCEIVLNDNGICTAK